MEQEYLTTRQMARQLGISTPTLRRAVKSGAIVPAHRTPGGHLRFRQAAAGYGGDGEEARLAVERAEQPGYYGAPATGRSDAARYQRIVEAAQEGIWELDAEDRTVFVNQKLADLLGYTVAEMIGMPLRSFLSEESYGQARASLQQHRQGRAGQDELSYRRKDGTSFWASVTSNSLFDRAGHYTGTLAMITDITVRKQAEAALGASEAWAQAVFEQAAVGMAIESLDGRFLAVNDRLCTLFGYRREELLTRSWIDVTHPDELAAGDNAIVRLSADPSAAYTVDKRYLRKDGATVWAHLTLSVVRDAAGAPARHLAVVEDISARVVAEEALRSGEVRMRAIVDTAADGIITIDDRGTIETFNPAASRLFGYAPGEVIGRDINLLMPEPHHAAHDGYLAHYLQTGEARIIGQGRDLTGQRKDGSNFPLNLAVSETALNERRIFTGIVRDMTERKRAEDAQALLLAREFAARVEAETTAQRLQALQTIAAELASALTPAEVVELIVSQAVDQLSEPGQCSHALRGGSGHSPNHRGSSHRRAISPLRNEASVLTRGEGILAGTCPTKRAGLRARGSVCGGTSGSHPGGAFRGHPAGHHCGVTGADDHR